MAVGWAASERMAFDVAAGAPGRADGCRGNAVAESLSGTSKGEMHGLQEWQAHNASIDHVERGHDRSHLQPTRMEKKAA